MMNELLTINHAAKRLGVSKKTIRRWEQQGKITSKRTAGGHRRFDISKLERQVSALGPRTFNARQVVIIALVSIVVTALITTLVVSDKYRSANDSDILTELESLPDNLELLDSVPEEGVLE